MLLADGSRGDQDGAVGSDNAAHGWHPNDQDDYEALSAELKKRFAAWVTEQGIAVDPTAPELICHHKWNYLDGHLTRWTPDNFSQLYLEVFPAKVIVHDDELDEVMDEARAFLQFLDATGLLDDKGAPAEVLVEHLSRIEDEFRKNMADPSRYSMGKRFMTEAEREGVKPGDQAGLEAFMNRFNARPRAQRDAVVGSILPARAVHGRATPPGTKPRPPSAKRRKRQR